MASITGRKTSRAGRTILSALVDRMLDETLRFDHDQAARDALWFLATTAGVAGYDEKQVVEAAEDGDWRAIEVPEVTLEEFFLEAVAIFETGELDNMRDAIRLGAGLRVVAENAEMRGRRAEAG